MISSEKQMLRLRMAEVLRAMGADERAEKSAAIAMHLRGLKGVVLGFAPMKLEPDWTGAIGVDWKLALPRIDGEALHFHRVEDFSALVSGSFGTREPAGGEKVLLREAAAVLVPGVAFDRAGARLGRGGGFYDRLLGDPALTARRVAVCFACQLVDRVPVEPHDAEVDAIVTEGGWIEMRNSGRGRG
ncbi:MAG: 5-formyltetrahydrofolate cyclo-ligase [Chthoniobacterales bacterium]